MYVSVENVPAVTDVISKSVSQQLNFVLCFQKCILLKVNVLSFVLFEDILYSYYWYFLSVKNQLGISQ